MARGRLARAARAGTENIRRRPGRAGQRSSSERRAGARGEEVSAFRPPAADPPSGESPLTPTAAAG